MDKQQEWIEAIEQKQRDREATFGGNPAFAQYNLATQQQLDREIADLVELCNAAGKPQGDWVAAKRSQLLQDLQSAMNDREVIQRQMHRDPGQPPLDVAALNMFESDQQRAYRKIENIQQLLSLL
jgi:hypothetical protein